MFNIYKIVDVYLITVYYLCKYDTNVNYNTH